MNRQVSYPSGFKCRKWTLVVLISIDLLVLILTTVALIQQQGNQDPNMDNRNETSKIPTLDQVSNFVNTVGENVAKLNITTPKINVDLGVLDNNATKQFFGGILDKARENEGTTKWVGQIGAIVIGFIICLIGLIGVILEHYCLSVTYAVVTFVGLLYTVLVGIYAEQPVLIGKIVMYILFLLLVAWYIIDLRNIRRQQRSQNI